MSQNDIQLHAALGPTHDSANNSANPPANGPTGGSRDRRRRSKKPKTATQSAPSEPSTRESTPSSTNPDQQPRSRPRNLRRHKKPASDPSAAAQDGRSQAKPNPKFLELNKLVKTYHPKTVNGRSVTSLSVPLIQHIHNLVAHDIYLNFDLKPSDPEFAFDLAVLKFSLAIPLDYPFYQYNDRRTRPKIVVLNEDIPKGFSLNIQDGFNKIVEKCVEQKTNGRRGKRVRERKKKMKKKDEETSDGEEDMDQEIHLVQGTDLCSIVATLDKYLERFLSQEKKETIKIVRYKKVAASNSSQGTSPAPSEQPVALPVAPPKNQLEIPPEFVEIRSREVHKFLQRLSKELNIRKFKSTQLNDVYSLNLPVPHLEVDPERHLVLDSIPCRIYVPTDYLFNETKAIKLEVDKNFIVDKVSTYQDSLERLQISTRINDMMKNFNNKISVQFVKQNREDVHNLKHSLTSQVNFFVNNCAALMNGDLEFLVV